MSYIKKILLLLAVLGVLWLFRDSDNNKIIKKSTPTPTIYNEKTVLPKTVKWPVPFTSQAPLGNWADVKEGNGCEEASILMAYFWAIDKKINPNDAANEIRNISDFSFKLLGHFHDISNEDTLKLLKEYFNYNKAYLENQISVETIKARLFEEKILIVAVNGDKLENPNYQIPKPANHKIVIVGFDDNTQEFITNDPGTSRGGGFRYKYDKLMGAITDYPTGYRESFEEIILTMIVIEKERSDL
ncbi:hypothetical protein A2574_03315 [Candidatus Shapirobacteria bacterium RIFOXYD1_FULL_38_32]|uniref:Peptidase C39-like domain-containing protein n=1 Tax=Candidatus Shapirobacteria bacterium RIFOXYB1_FULL_38_38 TaxID=1802151 RepID=A0A1F7SUC1_9BACT|nr:MAG: hypothetical protein A2195_00915 [Candidatus Shapirobacteria bacterium RIFOXYA1_FULL_39_17]OGL57381.1 MAG: hypothetical protein A2367_01645 [Candidatus Shapirobacteria bacterium RIFOXYB1_FULL_38_38]OGL58081.1 MAG: hypothetical protein A2574_03315 [Candidatus Shapirobacteria bacterium RIFOXYD1_FULL_38_32]HAP37987.1 hypothetical protein [Candidatus Shapirobacteria bacterium]HCU55061.1 hypothetical protein [Candidatus Shapirobacteria bacterium]